MAAFGGAPGSPRFLLSPLFCGEGTGPGAEPNLMQLGPRDRWGELLVQPLYAPREHFYTYIYPVGMG